MIPTKEIARKKAIGRMRSNPTIPQSKLVIIFFSICLVMVVICFGRKSTIKKDKRRKPKKEISLKNKARPNHCLLFTEPEK